MKKHAPHTKSIEYHKKKLFARLNPRKRDIEVVLVQIPVERSGKKGFDFLLIIKKAEIPCALVKLNKWQNPVLPHYKFALAVHYLYTEGKIMSSCSDIEYEIQQALGVAKPRDYRIKK